MKKVLSLMMALVLMLAMAVPAFAAETVATKDVYLAVNKKDEIVDSGERNNDTLGFTISWEADDITVSVEETVKQGKKWNPDEGVYEWDEETKETTYSGSNTQFLVDIQNLSAVPVSVSVTFTYAEGVERAGFVDYSVMGDKIISAAGENVEGGKTQVQFSIMAGESGVAEQIAKLVGENGSVRLGTITVSISKAE